MQRNEIETIFYTTNKNLLQMDHRSKYKNKNYKTLRIHKSKFLEAWVKQSLLGYGTKSISDQNKTK